MSTRGECDCCGQKDRRLSHCEVYGIETYACWECRGNDAPDDEEDDEPNKHVDEPFRTILNNLLVKP